MTQGMQVFVQNNVAKRVLNDPTPIQVPLFFQLLKRFPILRRIPARVIGLGFRPEHVRTKAAS
jgi:hypothetical protein